MILYHVLYFVPQEELLRDKLLTKIAFHLIIMTRRNRVEAELLSLNMRWRGIGGVRKSKLLDVI